MKNFLIQNWFTIAIILIAACYTSYLIYKKRWDKIRADAYCLMLKAEMVIKGTKRGQERFNYVFQQVYSLLPNWIQFFYPPDDLKKKLQKWFNKAKDKMDDGYINNSIN